MINLESFYSDTQSINFTDIQNDALETPFFESHNLLELNQLLQCYYNKDYNQTLDICYKLLEIFPQDSALYNLIACCFYGKGDYSQANKFFKNACDIAYSYHAVYHFIGYSLYCNRATLHHILGSTQAKEKDLSKAQFLYHQNNPNRDVPINIDEESLHFKNPVKDMIEKQKTIVHLSIFKESSIEDDFWKALSFFQKRQWNRALDVCDKLISKMEKIHLEYHYFTSCMFYNGGMNHIQLLRPDLAIGDFAKAISFDVRNPRNSLYKQALKKAQSII
jgi:tetratricopeptide (TPR) repeat protein